MNNHRHYYDHTLPQDHLLTTCYYHNNEHHHYSYPFQPPQLQLRPLQPHTAIKQHPPPPSLLLTPPLQLSQPLQPLDLPTTT
ncbi:hypothetical protein ElyMa_005690200 [Elysia marginata]|uniref:Uncharacterized protein n=1 Tax=Elysia marginata TaxID=1093978 RepID=A0AAV4FF36_9GAST|nr:hypothetical protein ElyMa_005690200 [Elysia marginata]